MGDDVEGEMTWFGIRGSLVAAWVVFVTEDDGVSRYAIAIDDATKLPLKVGMTANAVFTVRHLSSVLRVPNIYLRLDRTTSQSFTHVVNQNGTLAEVPVQVGLRSDECSWQIEKLPASSQVAVVWRQISGQP